MQLDQAYHPYSDVLKRHLEQHTHDFDPTRALVACISCHQRKLKCDNGTPCRSCVRDAVECIRATAWTDRGDSAGPDFGNVEEANGSMGQEQIMTIDFPDLSHVDSLMPEYDRQQLWLRNLQDPLSLQFPANTLGPRVQLDPDTAGLGQWPVHSGEARPMDGSISATLSEFSTATNSIRNGLAVESLPSEPHEGRDLDGHATSHLASQASSIQSDSDHVRDLHHFLNQEPIVTNRLLEMYFAEIQPCWPILHPPTFDAGKAEGVLMGSMVLLATWLESNSDHTRLASLVFDGVDRIITVGYTHVSAPRHE